MNRRSTPLVCLGLTTSLMAQSQWFVGPGGYAQIRDVMPLVANGDTVLVAPGTYFPFFCSRDITIRAATPGTVNIVWNILAMPQTCGCTCLSAQGPVYFQLPAQNVHVVGLSFAAAFVPQTVCFTQIHQKVMVYGTRVTFDNCAIDHMRIDNAAVHLQDCTITSAFVGAGILANSADVTIAGGSVAGSSATTSLAATPGIQLTNSRLHASGVTVTGGAASATSPGAPGIQATGGSLWLADATVTAGGGCAVSANGLVRIDRSTLNGSGASCALSPTGAPQVGIDRTGPIQIGQLFQVTLTSEPNALLVLYGSVGLAAPVVAPVLDQPVWIDATSLFLSDLTVATPLGQTTFSYAVPPFPALVGAQFWLQGVGGMTLPLQTTPVVGGIVR